MSNKKDPAVLFYPSNWLTSTAEMDADCVGWYLNLILHNYDKGDLPNDVENLAKLANVKFSEFNRFKQVFEQVLSKKFDLLENGRLSNLKTQQILRSRELFKDKRSNAGKISYLMRFFEDNYKNEYKDNKLKYFVKDNLDLDIDTKNRTLVQNMFEQIFELYINININENINKYKNKDKRKKFNFKKALLEICSNEQLIDDWLLVRKNKKGTNTQTAFESFVKQVSISDMTIDDILRICVEKSWSGYKFEWIKNERNKFPLKKESEPQSKIANLLKISQQLDMDNL